jgi:hypothetical protein
MFLIYCLNLCFKCVDFFLTVILGWSLINNLPIQLFCSSKLIFVGFVGVDITNDPLYDAISTPNSDWPTMIYQTTSSVPSQSVCSVMCTLSHRKCQFYVFIVISSTCNLGNVWTTSNAILADVGSSEIVHSRIPGSVLIFK